MFVRRLVLNHFRSYDSLDVSFPEGSVMIVGKNTSGKTNILEALYYMTLGRSFRKASDSDLIRKGCSEATIYLEYLNDRDKKVHTLSCLIGDHYKAFYADSEKVKSLSKILGLLVACEYDPNQVFLFRDEPAERRKLMDEVLSQISPKYLYAISRYKKLLKERNAAFAQDYDSDVIRVLRDQLINLSYRIVYDRYEFVESVSKKANENYRILFGRESDLKIKYKTNCVLETDQSAYLKKMTDLFEKNKSDETIRKMTLIGPHRDDMVALLGKNDVAAYGSQGENRLASLSLKLAVRDVLEEKLGVKPILLLDDVCSDLDSERCQRLLERIKGEGQVFLTGTKEPGTLDGYETYETHDSKLWRKNV